MLASPLAMLSVLLSIQAAVEASAIASAATSVHGAATATAGKELATATATGGEAGDVTATAHPSATSLPFTPLAQALPASRRLFPGLLLLRHLALGGWAGLASGVVLLGLTAHAVMLALAVISLRCDRLWTSLRSRRASSILLATAVAVAAAAPSSAALHLTPHGLSPYDHLAHELSPYDHWATRGAYVSYGLALGAGGVLACVCAFRLKAWLPPLQHTIYLAVSAVISAAAIAVAPSILPSLHHAELPARLELRQQGDTSRERLWAPLASFAQELCAAILLSSWVLVASWAVACVQRRFVGRHCDQQRSQSVSAAGADADSGGDRDGDGGGGRHSVSILRCAAGRPVTGGGGGSSGADGAAALQAPLPMPALPPLRVAAPAPPAAAAAAVVAARALGTDTPLATPYATIRLTPRAGTVRARQGPPLPPYQGVTRLRMMSVKVYEHPGTYDEYSGRLAAAAPAIWGAAEVALPAATAGSGAGAGGAAGGATATRPPVTRRPHAVCVRGCVQLIAWRRDPAPPAELRKQVAAPCRRRRLRRPWREDPWDSRAYNPTLLPGIAWEEFRRCIPDYEHLVDGRLSLQLGVHSNANALPSGFCMAATDRVALPSASVAAYFDATAADAAGAEELADNDGFALRSMARGGDCAQQQAVQLLCMSPAALPLPPDSTRVVGSVPAARGDTCLGEVPAPSLAAPEAPPPPLTVRLTLHSPRPQSVRLLMLRGCGGGGDGRYRSAAVCAAAGADVNRDLRCETPAAAAAVLADVPVRLAGGVQEVVVDVEAALSRARLFDTEAATRTTERCGGAPAAAGTAEVPLSASCDRGRRGFGALQLVCVPVAGHGPTPRQQQDDRASDGACSSTGAGVMAPVRFAPPQPPRHYAYGAAPAHATIAGPTAATAPAAAAAAAARLEEPDGAACTVAEPEPPLVHFAAPLLLLPPAAAAEISALWEQAYNASAPSASAAQLGAVGNPDGMAPSTPAGTVGSGGDGAERVTAAAYALPALIADAASEQVINSVHVHLVDAGPAEVRAAAAAWREHVAPLLEDLAFLADAEAEAEAVVEMVTAEAGVGGGSKSGVWDVGHVPDAELPEQCHAADGAAAPVRSAVLRFLRARGMRATADAVEVKRRRSRWRDGGARRVPRGQRAVIAVTAAAAAIAATAATAAAAATAAVAADDAATASAAAASAATAVAACTPKALVASTQPIAARLALRVLEHRARKLEIRRAANLSNDATRRRF